MIEFMCLMKMVLMRVSHGSENFGLSRESAFDNWPGKRTRLVDKKKTFFDIGIRSMGTRRPYRAS
jgi:hypothetical protein